MSDILDKLVRVKKDGSYEAELVDIHQKGLVEAILESKPAKAHDLVGLFLHSSGVYADAKTTMGPPKWQYSPDDHLDCFDTYMRFGCPNCGTEFQHLLTSDIPKLALQCRACGHRPAPLHHVEESESVTDRLFPANQNKDGSNDEGTETIYIRGTRRVHDFGQNEKAWWQQYYLPERVRNEIEDAAIEID